MANPFPNIKFYSSKLKEFADDNFNLNENGRKLSKYVEKTEGKREIACYKQFLLFPQRFQETCTADTSKPGFVWERVKRRPTSALDRMLEKGLVTETPGSH